MSNRELPNKGPKPDAATDSAVDAVDLTDKEFFEDNEIPVPLTHESRKRRRELTIVFFVAIHF